MGMDWKERKNREEKMRKGEGNKRSFLSLVVCAGPKPTSTFRRGNSL